LNRICAVKIDRKGHNPKELSVRRGELIEIEDSSKKWWRAKNFHGEVGHVPNNIVEEIEIEHRPLVCRKTSYKFILIILL
jgi:ribosomal protein L21E